MSESSNLLVRGVLCDITGVLYESGGKAIANSPEAIHRLRKSGIPFRFVTNESQCGGQLLVEKLRALGFNDLRVEEVFSPSRALLPVLRARGLRPFLLTHPGISRNLTNVIRNLKETVRCGYFGPVGPKCYALF